MDWKNVVITVILVCCVATVSAAPQPVSTDPLEWLLSLFGNGKSGGTISETSLTNYSYFNNTTGNVTGIGTNYFYNWTLVYSEMNQTPNQTPGAPGAAASIHVNYTFTEEPDLPAYVENIGNESDASLDFYIPRGYNGTDGVDGYTPIKGVDYFDGINGTNGINGTDGVDGYTPIKGVDYFDGINGTNGINGTDGAQGPPGPMDDNVFFKNLTRNITGTIMRKDVDNSYLWISGATTGTYPPPAISLYGKDYSNAPDAGDIVFYVGNATGTLLEMLRINGKSDTRSILIEAPTSFSDFELSDVGSILVSSITGIKRDVDNSYINLYGGNATGAAITINGPDSSFEPGNIDFWTTDASHNIQQTARFVGDSDTRTLDMLGNRIVSVGTPTSSGDAATKAYTDGKGYTIQFQALTSSPTDGQTVYFGSLPKAPTTTAATSKQYIPRAGTIKKVYVYSYSGTAGTNELWQMLIRINNAADTRIANLSVNTNERVWSNTGLAISVNAGDYFEIKGIQPTWATNPATTIYGGTVYIE